MNKHEMTIIHAMLHIANLTHGGGMLTTRYISAVISGAEQTSEQVGECL